MTTLSANTGVTLTVGATDMLLIDCPSGGRARVEAISGVDGASTKKILVEHPGGRRQYGPFGAGTISLGAIGQALRYDYGVSPSIPDTSPALYNPETQSLVSGAGNIAINLPRANTMICMGDSWIDLGFQPANGGEQASGWLTVANIMLGRPFDLVDAGVSGDTTTQMLARFAADVLAVSSGWVYIPGGTINDPAASITAATAIENVRSMLAQARGSGRVVVTSTVPTNTLLASAAYDDRRRYQATMNNWLRRNAKAYGAILIDIDSVCTDPATGTFRTNYSYDGVHLSYVGTHRLGGYAADLLQEFVPEITPVGAQLLDPYNLLGPTSQVNGDNASGSGGTTLNTGVSGTGPNGWGARRGPGASAMSIVASTVTKAGTPYQGGSAGRIVVTASTDDYKQGMWLIGGDNVTGVNRWDTTVANSTAYTYGKRVLPSPANGYIYSLFTPGTTAASAITDSASWSTTEGAFVTSGTAVFMVQRIPLSGEQIYGEMEFECSGLTGNAGVMLSLLYVDTAAAQTEVIGNVFNTDSSRGEYPDRVITHGVIRTPLMARPAVAPQYILLRPIVVGRASSVLTLDVWNASIRNYTQEVAL